MSGRDTASLETGAGAKAANSSVDDLSVVIRELDKKAQGEYSLRLLLAANNPEQLRDNAPAVHRIFVDTRAQVIEETLGNLCAFYAMLPGNGKFNVFPMWLSEEHHARLSSVFAPHIGHPYSEDLDSEYLNVFETRTRTPFFQDVYVDGVRVSTESEGAISTQTRNESEGSSMLEDVTFLRLPDVKALTGLSKTSLYTLIRQRDFPAPVRLGPRAVAWVRAEVKQWAANRILASRAAISFTGVKRMPHSVRPASRTSSRRSA